MRLLRLMSTVVDDRREPVDLVFESIHEGGETSGLTDALQGAEMVLMVATTDEGTDAAAAIGVSCQQRGVITGGIVFAHDNVARVARSALRPHAQILLVTQDKGDLPALLTALRV